MTHFKKRICFVSCLLWTLNSTALAATTHQSPQIETIVTTQTLKPSADPRTATGFGHTYSQHSVSIYAQTAGTLETIHFQPGQKVKKGQVLFSLKPTAVSNQLAYLKSQLETAEQTYQRNLKLSQQDPNSLSKLDLIKEKNTFQQAQLAFDQAKNIQNILSPINGIVTDCPFNPGTIISPTNISTPLATVVNGEALQVKYQLPSRYSAIARVGQHITFTPADSTSQYQGKVSYVSPQIDPNNGALNVIATLNSAKTMPPNVFGQIVQIVKPNHQALLINQSYVDTDVQGFYVYLYHNHQATRHYFKAGQVNAKGLIEVLHGLKPGDQLITMSPERLSAGQKVRLKTP